MITRETLKFLSELAKHNRREWFQSNKPRYEEHVKAATEDFVERAAPEVAKISKRLEGGAMRIYRDTRFSKAKTPYRTHIGIHFGSARQFAGPGYYLHVAPAEVFFAAGMWHPEPPLAKQVREAIAKKPADWKKVTRGLELEPERLARVPRGFAADDKLADQLRLKSFCAIERLDEKQLLDAKFVRQFAALCKKTAPLMKFLAGAVGVPF